MDHAEAGEPIRIVLGPSEQVRGRRRSLGRQATGPQTYEEVFELVIENSGDHPVLTEIEDHPPASLQWRLIRSTMPLAISRGRITLSPEVGARSELRVQYRLQFTQPPI